MGREECIQLCFALLIARQICDEMFGQHTGKEGMHALFGIADRHGGDGIAVITALEGHEFGASAHTLVKPVLRRHLHRHFDGDRTAVAEEDAAELFRQKIAQASGQRQHLFVDKAAQHDMRQGFELLLNHFANVRMIIAVAGGPP